MVCRFQSCRYILVANLDPLVGHSIQEEAVAVSGVFVVKEVADVVVFLFNRRPLACRDIAEGRGVWVVPCGDIPVYLLLKVVDIEVDKSDSFGQRRGCCLLGCHLCVACCRVRDILYRISAHCGGG